MAREQEKKSATSFDVARHAGVSQSTVSLVFGGKASGRVAPLKQQEILQAAQELGYRPNAVARMLRLGRTNIIALIIPDVGNPFFANILRGAEQAARKHNYAVVLVNTGNDQDWQQIIVDVLTTHAIEGFIFCATRPPDRLDNYIPKEHVVMVDESVAAISSIVLDIEGGTLAAMQHLLELGHQKIAHLAADIPSETFWLRQTGYDKALQRAGMTNRPAYTVKTALTREAATVAALKLLDMADPPGAIFCDDDILAVGVYKAAHQRGLQVPQQLSVVGFSDNLMAQTVEPELTTVAIPALALGMQATKLLIAGLSGKEGPQREYVALSLQVRGSTTRIVVD